MTLARWSLTWSITLVLLSESIVGQTTTAAAAITDAVGIGRCQDVEIPVALVDGGPKNQRVSGRLCDPPQGRSSTVQVLVAGFTYSKIYWDFPVDPAEHSYADSMSGRGFSTLSIDRLGTGDSSYPPSALLTLNTHAAVLHQVIDALRAGQLPGGAARGVVGVGHSYGSAVVYHEAATYHDVDAIVPSGATHLISGLAVSRIALAATQPAVLDPRTRGRTPPQDPGYVTTRPGTRAVFHARDVDPAVLAEDERTASTGTPTELATIAQYEVDTTRVRVPVLLAVGDEDQVMCAQQGDIAITDCRSAADLKRSEQAFFPRAALSAYVLPDAGHDINLAPRSHEWFAAVAGWLTAVIPAH